MKTREIKFRAWDPEAKSMDMEPNFFFESGVPLNYNGDIFMQYTGLRDKNGVEVYEGDVVACDGMFDSETGQTETDLRVVEYRGSSIALVEYIVNEGESKEDLLFVEQYIGPGVEQDDFLEVIGNIYEHPDLLTK